MCAINPKHKKRIIFDFYTSKDMPEKDFIKAVLDYVVQAEMTMNQYGDIRAHFKETEQEAD